MKIKKNKIDILDLLRETNFCERFYPSFRLKGLQYLGPHKVGTNFAIDLGGTLLCTIYMNKEFRLNV